MQPAVSMAIMLCVISVASFVAVVGVALIALGSSGAFSSKDTNVRTTTSTITATITTTTTNSSVTTSASNTTKVTPITRSLNSLTLYPNGSSVINITSYQNYSGALYLVSPSSSIFSELADNDPTSQVFESQRKQNLYFVLSNTPQSRSLSVLNNTVNVTGIIIHFGPTTNNESFVLIPLPNSTTNTSQPTINDDIATFNTSNGTIVIRIRIKVPNDTCPSTDECLSLEYQAYAVVSSSFITLAKNSKASVACGNVCSLSNSTCSQSCNNTCNTPQNASNATIATRRYIMNSTAGTFQFNYSNPEQEIKIYAGESLLFNRNCSQIGGSTNVTYNSTSSLIRVDVEPTSLCSNSTANGTAWSFNVGCN